MFDATFFGPLGLESGVSAPNRISICVSVLQGAVAWQTGWYTPRYGNIGRNSPHVVQLFVYWDLLHFHVEYKEVFTRALLCVAFCGDWRATAMSTISTGHFNDDWVLTSASESHIVPAIINYHLSHFKAIRCIIASGRFSIWLRPTPCALCV